jgi:hypothetical protein
MERTVEFFDHPFQSLSCLEELVTLVDIDVELLHDLLLPVVDVIETLPELLPRVHLTPGGTVIRLTDETKGFGPNQLRSVPRAVSPCVELLIIRLPVCRRVSVCIGNFLI